MSTDVLGCLILSFSSVKIFRSGFDDADNFSCLQVPLRDDRSLFLCINLYF